MCKYKDMIKYLCSESYMCSVCGDKIYPIIKNLDLESNCMDVEINKNQFRGGIGNKIIQDNICNGCAKVFDIFSE